MKKIVTILYFALLTVIAYSQNTSISGVVKNSKNEPVIGAAVMIDGVPGIGTITDVDGRFFLKFGETKNAKLRVSCISFKDAIVPLDARTVYEILLEDDIEQLDEVVVVGYGSMHRSDITGAVTSVKIDEDEAAAATSMDQLLQGKAAGVNIINNSSAPDAGVDIRIRGINSFNSSNQPLYVIDGIIINGSSQSSSLLSRGTDSNETDQESNGLMGINPQDIASIEILKDASATAIYGSQGANGVILITSKQAKTDKPTVTVNLGANVGLVTKRLPTLLFDEYVQFMKEGNHSIANIYDDSGQLKATPVDWQAYSIKPAITQRYYMSVSGRPNKNSYFVSMGYQNNDGLLRGTGYNTFTGRINADFKITPKLTIGTNNQFSYTHTNMTQATALQQSANSSYTRSIISYRPYRQNSEEDEELMEFDTQQVAGPDKWISDFVNTKDRFRVVPAVYLNYRIIDWLTFRVNAGGEYSLVSEDRFKSIRISSQTGSTASRGKNLSARYNVDATFNFNKKFKRGHTLSGTLGFSMSSISSKTESQMGWDIEQYKSKMDALNSALSTQQAYSENMSSLMSGFARVIYNYKERYVLTSTVRLDGSSRFQGKNKWGVFPSFAFAWRISQEPWFHVPVISMAKLRVGWGKVGNQTIGNYKTLQNYSTGTVGSHYNDPVYSQTAIWRNNIPNPDLKWETTEQTNVGLDINFFKGRLSVSAEGYYKVTYDLLKNMTVAKSNGFGSVAMNSGSIQNAGFEFTLEAVPVKIGKNFEWSLSGNISLNRNKILSIGQGKETGVIRDKNGDEVTTAYYFGDKLSSSSVPLNIFAEGYPVGVFYGYVFDGIVQTGEQGMGFNPGETRDAGHLKYRDLNGNGYLDDGDRQMIGDPNPDFTYGFSTTIRYKSLSLMAQFSGSYGNDVYNMNHMADYDVSSASSNIMQEAYRNAWRPDAQNNSWPGINKVETVDKQSMHSNRFVEDGSYLRLSNLSLTWKIPIKKPNSKILRAVSIGASVKNAFVITKYTGWDPEVSSFGTNLNKIGIDSNSYPQMRSYLLDVQFRF